MSVLLCGIQLRAELRFQTTKTRLAGHRGYPPDCPRGTLIFEGSADAFVPLGGLVHLFLSLLDGLVPLLLLRLVVLGDVVEVAVTGLRLVVLVGHVGTPARVGAIKFTRRA